MKIMTRAYLLITYHVCVAACLLAVAGARAEGQRQAHFVDLAALALETKIPVPPAAGSLAELADLEAVLQVQARRTAADAAWANTVTKGDVFSASDIVGPWFTGKHLPHVAELFSKLEEEAIAVTDRAKERYRRARPYMLSTEVEPSAERSTTYSYPSGYAVQVFVRAGALAELFPEMRAALFAQAHQHAWARVVGGVHYPSDDVAGRLLAELLVAELHKSAAFRTAIEQARREIEAQTRK
jgi:acid phosphatase (class A)